MGKRWMAPVLLALALGGMMAAPPLAKAWTEAAKGRDPAAEEIAFMEPAPEMETSPETAEWPEDYLPVSEIPQPAGSLADVRAVWVEGVSEEYRDAARYAVYRGLLETGPDRSFNGEEPAVRGEAVAALYRLSGIQVQVDACPYPDVPAEYQDAVAWASYAGISGGVPEDRFAPFSPVTRSQLAVMLYRFASWRGEDVSSPLAVFPLQEEIPDYAQEAWNWVLDRELYAGMTDNGLYPDLPVSRNQLACILARLQKDRDLLAAELILPSAGTVSRSRQNHEALNDAIRAAARRHGAVGVQVAVIEDGAVTDTYEYGWAVQGVTPMTSQHKMRVASLSKVAVGVCAALLREEGVIGYDTNIGDYWGLTPWKPVTIRSMLTHTSTLLNSESIAWDYEGVRAQLASASGYGSGTPGSLGHWSYNNHAFGILGQTLELASGRYLDEILQDRLLDYLGADGSFAAGELEHPELISPLYRAGGSLGRSQSSLVSVRRWNAPGDTGRQFAGGFTTSARDFAKLAAVLAGDGCFEGVRLMDAQSVTLMEHHSGQALPGGTYQAMPMRLRYDTYGRDALYYHTGSAYGVYNLVSYDPFTADGVVVLTMGAGGGKDACGIYSVCGEISQAVYGAIQ